KAITTLRSGKVVDKTIPPKDSAKESSPNFQNESKGDENIIENVPSVPTPSGIEIGSSQERAKYIPAAPFPQRLRAPKKLSNHAEIFELFKQVKVNIPLLDAIKQVPSYAKFLKDLCTAKRKLDVHKEVFMTEQSTSLLQNTLPRKYKDPGTPTIEISIGNSKVGRALVDLGASVNLLPYSVYVELGLGELESTSIKLQLADRSVKIPRGVVKDV
ncbi:retroviral-like aspartic protease, partial [Solirubrobacter sp. CPCC 204708]|nr:retroviral-like aspartic protease [Solirubrobacter deserti]